MSTNPKSVPPPTASKSAEQAKDAILALIRRTESHILIGQASIHLGAVWTLAKTEILFDELLAEGRIRRLTKAECRKADVCEAFDLVDLLRTRQP